MLNVLGITFSPSVALIVNEYVVFVATSGSVPEITPVAEFNVTPLGKDDPFANAYVTVESESDADNADKVIDTCSLNVPSDPDAVCHTGDALT
jgi:hypothetical protein